MNDIVIWNRAERRDEIEKVYGEKFVRFLYEKPAGQSITSWIVTLKLISKVYGAYQSSILSRRKIKPFIRDFKIPMQEYEDIPYSSFNDFFIRRFRPGARNFVDSGLQMPAFAEARYFAYESIGDQIKYPVKGRYLSVQSILAKTYKEFDQGPMLIARLCPTDYHRFHFPDDGRVVENYRVKGRLHSVNPLALGYKSNIFATNEREVTILETHNFGLLAYVEVGALCVGRIVQSHPKKEFRRGQEKGYFLFGGSTVIVMGQKGVWRPSKDLLEQTAKGRETFVRLGEAIGEKLS